MLRFTSIQSNLIYELSSRIVDFVNYMRENETDPLMVLKFLKQLPHSMF